MGATALRVAVIGGGWAGMAAAVRLAQAGHHPTVFEAAPQLGGRARRLPAADPAWGRLDNGQHILIGAYRQTLALMREVGADPDTLLLRLPLELLDAQGHGLHLPDLPPPWDALIGIVRATGPDWSLQAKWALLRLCAQWQHAQFRCPPEATVADLCRSLPQTVMASVMQGLIEPLCVSALNLPASQASGALFLRTLQDGLFSGRGGSNFLIPRVDLSALLPEPCAQWLATRGCAVHTHARVMGLHCTPKTTPPSDAAPSTCSWQLTLQNPVGLAQIDAGQVFDAVLLATTAPEAARLVQNASRSSPAEMATAMKSWADTAQHLQHTAIATVYARTAKRIAGHADRCLPRPMVALQSGPLAPAQFAFDRAVLNNPAGLIALVVSAAHGERSDIEQQTIEQARIALHLPDLQAVQTVVEKRATFACIPGVKRPPTCVTGENNAGGAASTLGLWACGDYVDGPYPATLEGAVISGELAVKQLLAAHAAPHTSTP